ncbi:MAG: lysine--tRNA ligase, partial [Desulfobacterales bacterium]|nr:lysine--tRNA ligase [Desulfobacterales bacterium]
MEKTSPLIEERRKKADALRDLGVRLYPAGFRCDMTAAQAEKRYGQMDEEALEKEKQSFSMAGRIMAVRSFGKASFIQL